MTRRFRGLAVAAGALLMVACQTSADSETVSGSETVSEALPESESAAVSTSMEGESLRLIFVGNEGFLLESGGRKVLVDALVDTEYRRYVWQGSELREDLALARPPFDDVDLILASHFHGDHFDPVEVARHLVNNPRGRFVSTPDAVAKMRAEVADFEAIADRVVGVLPNEGEVSRFPELGLDVYHLHHGRDRPHLQNLGLVFQVGPWTIGQVGDTEADDADFRASGFPAELDLGLFPGWFFRPDSAKVVDRVVKAKRWVPIHVATGENAEGFQGAEWVEQVYTIDPGALLFTRLRETCELFGDALGIADSGCSAAWVGSPSVAP